MKVAVKSSWIYSKNTVNELVILFCSYLCVVNQIKFLSNINTKSSYSSFIFAYILTYSHHELIHQIIFFPYGLLERLEADLMFRCTKCVSEDGRCVQSYSWLYPIYSSLFSYFRLTHSSMKLSLLAMFQVGFWCSIQFFFLV